MITDVPTLVIYAAVLIIGAAVLVSVAPLLERVPVVRALLDLWVGEEE